MSMLIQVYTHGHARARSFGHDTWMGRKVRGDMHMHMHMHRFTRGQFRGYARERFAGDEGGGWRWLPRQTVSSIGIAGIARTATGVHELSATIYIAHVPPTLRGFHGHGSWRAVSLLLSMQGRELRPWNWSNSRDLGIIMMTSHNAIPRILSECSNWRGAFNASSNLKLECIPVYR